MSVDPQTQSLFDAIAAVNYDRVKLAIDSGVNINSPNSRGQTPLAVACRQGNLEIVDLLVAAGAQMQAQPDLTPPVRIESIQPVTLEVLESPVRDRQISFESLIESIHQPADSNATEIEAEMPESPVREQQIPFENLIELIHQPANHNPTEIEQFIPIEHKSLVPEALIDRTTNAPTHNTELQKIAANWQDMSSDAEATYTFDLEAVFAANDVPDSLATLNTMEMFVDSEITLTSLRRPAQEVEFEMGETYAFDLSPDLDRLTAEACEEPDRLSMPIGEWCESETYVVDDLPQLLPELAEAAIDSTLEHQQQLEIDRLFGLSEDQFALNEAVEDGETYAIDLDDLNSYELMMGRDLAVRSEQHLLGDLDPSLFPELLPENLTESDDRPDFDPDTQTSTDIFGQSRTKDDEDDLAPVYEENATNTSLMAATIDGDLDLVQQAIEAGASLDRYDWNLGYSPLGMAIDRGQLDIVQCLLTAGANPHTGNISTTALGLAAERGEVEIIQMLLPRGVDINAPVGQDGWTALLSAIKNGHRSVVQLLVTAGANVNIWSRGETPILLAAKCEDREIYLYLYPLVNTAIRLCADRDGEHLLQATRKRRIREQNRPVEKFIEMATMGNIDEVNRAIEIGIEVDELGARGHTALMAAAYHGHRSLVNILLAAGADPNLLSDGDGLGMGMTALMLAAGSFFASNRQGVVQLLIAGGADVNQRGAGGKTAIMYAALAGSGYVDCVETLIAADADLDFQDDRGHTVLSSVAAVENYPMFNLLMQAGASTAGLESIQLIQAAGSGNVDRVRSLLATKVNLDLDRGAAIGSAAAAGHTQIVELLIRAGANVNLRDKLGFTPIASAAYAGYGEIVQLLIAAGADIQAPAGESQSYSALEYAQMGLYQFDRADLQHAQIIRQLEQLGAR
jgi:ankyrin repeat protein